MGETLGLNVHHYGGKRMKLGVIVDFMAPFCIYKPISRRKCSRYKKSYIDQLCSDFFRHMQASAKKITTFLLMSV